MFAKNICKRPNVKYDMVENQDGPIEIEEKKRNFCNLICLWSNLFTTALIGIYYIPSICLTFYQRWLLQSFQFPLVTVTIHMSVKFFLAVFIRFIFERNKNKQRLIMDWKEYLKAIAPMGIASGLDIGFSNWGLELVLVSLYTMTKSTTVVFILGFAMLFKIEKKSWSLASIVGMITIGLILFTYKATQFNILGFTLLIIASVSSGVRWTCVQLLLQKSKLGMKSPIDMIYHMQPWMILAALPLAIVIEGPRIIQNKELITNANAEMIFQLTFKVLLGAFIAFFMEVCEVLVVGYTSSLTLSIAGIVKEVFMLVLAVEFNGDQLSAINVIGLLICLFGIICHVYQKLKNTSKDIGRNYGFYNERRELGKKLITNEEFTFDGSSDNEDKNDAEVLFNILHSHDR